MTTTSSSSTAPSTLAASPIATKMPLLKKHHHGHHNSAIAAFSFFSSGRSPALLLLLPCVVALALLNLAFQWGLFDVAEDPPADVGALKVPSGCDIFRGEWVADDRARRYRSCQYIQEHQNCVKYGRPDLGYLSWRWRPDGCELPRLDPAGFLELMRNQGIAFVGDSLARNHMQSLLCLLSQAERPRDVSATEDPNFRDFYFRRHNFTVSSFWSPFLVRARQTDADGPNHTGFWDLYLDEVDPAWGPHAHRYTHLVLSASNWFTRPSVFYQRRQIAGCHFCRLPGVRDLSLRHSIRMAYRTALAFAGSEAAGAGAKKWIVRTVSPSHFENGEWNTGGDCPRTKPYGRNESSVGWLEDQLYKIQVEEFREAAGKQSGGPELMLMDATEAMTMRPDGHPSRYGHRRDERVAMPNDCVHWCLPGPVDTWNDMLFQMIIS